MSEVASYPTAGGFLPATFVDPGQGGEEAPAELEGEFSITKLYEGDAEGGSGGFSSWPGSGRLDDNRIVYTNCDGDLYARIAEIDPDDGTPTFGTAETLAASQNGATARHINFGAGPEGLIVSTANGTDQRVFTIDENPAGEIDSTDEGAITGQSLDYDDSAEDVFVPIGDDKVAVFTLDKATNDNIYYTVIESDGTIGSSTLLVSDAKHFAVTKLSDTAAVLVYTQDSGDRRPQAQPLTISGSTISTNGAATELHDARTLYVGVAALTATRFVTFFNESFSFAPTPAVVKLFSISGSTVAELDQDDATISENGYLYRIKRVSDATAVALVASPESETFDAKAFPVDCTGDAVSIGAGVQCTNLTENATLTRLNSNTFVTVGGDQNAERIAVWRLTEV